MRTERFDSEDALIRACVAGDHDAWECFIRRYDGLILASIGNRLRKYDLFPGSDGIREIHQSILASLWETGRLSGIRDPRSLRYWLAAVSGNMALDHMRKRSRIEQAEQVSLSDAIDDGELEALLPAGDMSASERLSNAELAERLDWAIDSLPVNEKLAIRLALLHGKKHAEVARIMGIPQGTAFSYIRKAKKKLRVYLADLQ